MTWNIVRGGRAKWWIGAGVTSTGLPLSRPHSTTTHRLPRPIRNYKDISVPIKWYCSSAGYLMYWERVHGVVSPRWELHKPEVSKFRMNFGDFVLRIHTRVCKMTIIPLNVVQSYIYKKLLQSVLFNKPSCGPKAGSLPVFDSSRQATHGIPTKVKPQILVPPNGTDMFQNCAASSP